MNASELLEHSLSAGVFFVLDYSFSNLLILLSSFRRENASGGYTKVGECRAGQLRECLLCQWRNDFYSVCMMECICSRRT